MLKMNNFINLKIAKKYVCFTYFKIIGRTKGIKKMYTDTVRMASVKP